MEINYYTVQYNKSQYNEKDWKECLSVFLETGEPVIEELKPFRGKVPDEILIPIGRIIGTASALWLNKELTEIPGYTPLSLLQSEDGTKALKAVIMRLYC